jgi:filamentous hemagglutinin family protein
MLISSKADSPGTWIVLALVCTVMPTPAAAQIKTDGTVGLQPARDLLGPHYEITADLGKVKGANLFHSFEQFNIRTLDTGTIESATFTGPDNIVDRIANVVSRVTGTAPSEINGLLRSEIGRADFWFINPNGVTFGPNAHLDVPASFHVSTANELRFDGGATFNASSPDASTLTVAAPQSFGFLGDNPAAISLRGSSLGVAENSTVSIVGGDIDMVASSIFAPAGRIGLASLSGDGKIVVPDERIRSPGLLVDPRQELGNISLSTVASIDASGNRGGSVVIRASNVVLDNSFISAFTGEIDGAAIAIDVELDKNLILRNLSEIRADILQSSEGDAGDVLIKADIIDISDRSRIGSSGYIFSGGNPGQVIIAARKMRLTDRGNIDASSGVKTGGTPKGVKVIVADDLLISGEEETGIFSESGTTKTPIVGGGPIIPVAREPGGAGPVTVTAGEIRMNGGSISSASVIGSADKVHVIADKIQLSGGAQITAQSSDFFATRPAEEAGSVVIEARQLLVLSNSSITTQAVDEKGGDIEIVNTKAIALFGTGAITTSAEGPGGNILMRPGALAFQGGSLSANSSSDRGGAIRVIEGLRIDDTERRGEVTASGPPGLDGTIEISATEEDLTGDLAELPATFLVSERLFEQSCAARSGQPVSSLVSGGQGGLPADPGRPLVPLYLADRPDEAATDGDQNIVGGTHAGRAGEVAMASPGGVGLDCSW